MCRCILALWLLFPLSLTLAAESVRTSPEQVRRWLEQLDDDDFSVREQAAAALARAGHPAIMPLAEGILSQNPEVAWRSSETLQRMAMESDEATMDRIVHVLGDLAKRGKPGLAQFATEMRDKQRAFRHNRAAGELRKLGAYVAGADGQMAEVDEFGDMIGVPAAIGIEFDEPVMEMVEIEEPAIEEIAQDKPLWRQVLEGLRILEPAPVVEIDVGVDVEELKHVEIGSLPEVEDAADEASRGIFAGMRGAFAKVAKAKVIATEGILGAFFGPAAHPDYEEEPPVDFRLPALDLDDEGLEDLAADEIFPGEEMVEMEEVPGPAEIVDIGGPVFIGGMFGGGIMMADGSGASGVMSLTREWRGGNDALKHLQDLSGVTNLQIEHAELSDAALTHIAKMSSLKHLQIRGGKFSRDALRTFHRQRPTVSIMAMGEGMMGVNGQFNADGCVLDTVFAGSAAHDAGLQAGDKVTSIDGEPVKDFSDLTISVSTRKPGDKFKVVYQRGGTEHEVELTLKQRGAGQ